MNNTKADNKTTIAIDFLLNLEKIELETKLKNLPHTLALDLSKYKKILEDQLEIISRIQKLKYE
ncbi:MAG: hypothetical protein PHE73_09135 [Sulfurovaceae bacterium]|nr:hypothetical protein [Sulfurovaceae bacterium]